MGQCAFLYICVVFAYTLPEGGDVMRNNQPRRMLLMLSVLFLGMMGMLIQLCRIAMDGDAVQAGVKQGKYHLEVPLCEGTVYDRFLRPLHQTEERLLAVVSPNPETVAAVLPILKDRSAVIGQLHSVSPFVCELTQRTAENQNLRILEGRCSRPGTQTAQHLLGYRQGGIGVAGLEASFDRLLQSYDAAADVMISVDAHGAALPGDESSVRINRMPGGGLVTTLDVTVQKIAETALHSVLPAGGAAVVLDSRCGDILACASVPVYNPDALAEALDDPGEPFLNRALCAYNVGSVFKLAVAASALEYSPSAEFCCVCDGYTEINGRLFRCHDRTGHGLLDLRGAMTASCNPYFISMTQLIPAEHLHHTAQMLGFGQPVQLAPGLIADAGRLQSAEELEVAAEKANFSFGQGMLLATPLQIAAMTACIANDGIWTLPRLIAGETPDGRTVIHEQEPYSRRALRPDTALRLREIMTAVLADPDHGNGAPSNSTAGGKTSTAQTGRFAPDGTEYCHAWMTGFFPADAPRYTVTVLVENGGSGNSAAAPVFRKIIEEMTRAGL